MSSKIMPAQRALEYYLLHHEQNAESLTMSGFQHALREARLITNREVTTGIKQPGMHGTHGSWLGCVGYFALLDQLGKAVIPQNAGRRSRFSDGIRRALTHFTSLPEAEINALYALRCAFAHDYSLYNVHDRDITLTHNFVVGQGPGGRVVQLPMEPWDGSLANQRSTCKTTINLEAFGDLCEQVVASAINHARQGTLEVILAGGSDELLRRYMFAARVTP